MQTGMRAHTQFSLTLLCCQSSYKRHHQHRQLKCTSVLMYAGSDLHFAVLTTDNCWRLYHADKLAEPEQTFELQTSTKRYTTSANALFQQSAKCTPASLCRSLRHFEYVHCRAGSIKWCCLRRCRPFGMHFMDDDDFSDTESRRHAVGFAFGPAYGWERFTVDPPSILMSSDCVCC